MHGHPGASPYGKTAVECSLRVVGPCDMALFCTGVRLRLAQYIIRHRWHGTKTLTGKKLESFMIYLHLLGSLVLELTQPSIDLKIKKS